MPTIAKRYALRHKPTGQWQGNHYEFHKNFDMYLTYFSKELAEQNLKAFVKWASHEKPDGVYKDAIKMWKEAEVVEITITAES